MIISPRTKRIGHLWRFCRLSSSFFLWFSPEPRGVKRFGYPLWKAIHTTGYVCAHACISIFAILEAGWEHSQFPSLPAVHILLCHCLLLLRIAVQLILALEKSRSPKPTVHLPASTQRPLTGWGCESTSAHPTLCQRNSQEKHSTAAGIREQPPAQQRPLILITASIRAGDNAHFRSDSSSSALGIILKPEQGTSIWILMADYIMGIISSRCWWYSRILLRAEGPSFPFPRLRLRTSSGEAAGCGGARKLKSEPNRNAHNCPNLQQCS